MCNTHVGIRSYIGDSINRFTLRTVLTQKVIMDTTDVDKSKALVMVEIIEYSSNSVISRTIIKKSTGNISVMSFDSGEGLTEKISPFDTFAQIIDGRAEVVIDGISILLETGQSIIIPAHTPNTIIANERFKMILTVIKSGYDS